MACANDICTIVILRCSKIQQKFYKTETGVVCLCCEETHVWIVPPTYVKLT